MPSNDKHLDYVDAWLSKRIPQLGRDERLELLQAALDSLWQRTRVTLGEITIAAIAARVVHLASQTFPALSSLSVDATGFHVTALRKHEGDVKADDVAAWMRLVVAEFMRVVGSLTAEVLTPGLQAALEATQGPAPAGEEGKR